MTLSLFDNAHHLPVKISQEEWKDAKKKVTLSTGIDMAYIEMGNPNGEVVILQHGMTDNSRSFSLAVSYFTEAGYHVYLPDLRGMGESSQPDGFYTVVTYATDMKAFLDTMGIDQAIMIGHSLGSFTVQTFALMFPKKCKKIVLLSSIPLRGIQNMTLKNAYEKYIAPLADDEHPSNAFMDAWYQCEAKEEDIKDGFDVFLAHMKSEAQVLSKKAWKNIFLGLIASNNNDLYSLMDTSIPTLILHGNEDTMTPTQYQEELCELLNVDKNCYRNYEGVGHNIQFEIPKQSSKDILGWLETGLLPE